MKKNRVPYIKLKEEEVLERKKKVCKKCEYYSIIGDRVSIKNSTCDYILKVGHSRGCDPRDCVERGIFKQKKERKERKKQSFTF